MFHKVWTYWSGIPPSLRRALGFVGITLIVAQAVYLVFSGALNDLYEVMSGTSVSLHYAFVMVVLLSIGVWAFFKVKDEGHLARRKRYEQDIEKLNERLHLLQLDNENQERLLRDLNLEIDLDQVTGIPNERKFRWDMRHRLYQDLPVNFCLLYLDLDDFKEINSSLLFLETNKVLRVLAQNIQDDMRRNEGIWKREAGADAYRKNTGGDEFLFFLRGSKEDGVKFVKFRLTKIFAKTSDELAEKLDGRRLKFSGAMKYFSKPEVASLAARSDQRDIIEVINAELVKLHRQTTFCKEGRFGFWFVWSGLPTDKFASNAEENLQVVDDEAQRELLSFFKLDGKDRVFGGG